MPWFSKKNSESPTPSRELAKVMGKIHAYQLVWQIVEEPKRFESGPAPGFSGAYGTTQRLYRIESRTTDGIWIQMKSDWSSGHGYGRRTKTTHVCSVSIRDANYRPTITLYEGSFALENNRRDCEYIDNYIHGVIRSIHAADSSRQAFERGLREAAEQRVKEQEDRARLEQKVKKGFGES